METSKLKHFWSHRPPYVVFLCCIASFGLTLFSLSVFVAQNDKIPNPDVLDWNKLLKKLTKIEFCIPQNQTVIPKVVKKDWINVSLSVQVSQDFSQALGSSPVQATGEILLKYLKVRPEFESESIAISFRVNDQENFDCLDISGPKKLLKNLEQNDTICSKKLQNLKQINLQAHSQDHKPVDWCQSDKSVNLDFEMDFNPELTMYVNSQDRELIHLHLMVTSVFLFAVLALVIVAFLIKSVKSKTKDHHILVMTQLDQDSP